MNQKKQRGLAIFALAIALLATSIAYAALSATLKISGNVVRKGVNVNVHFSNITTPVTTGTGKMSTSPAIDGTTLTFGVELSKPGDSVKFDFTLVNDGDVTMHIVDKIDGTFNNVEFVTSSDLNSMDATSEDITCSLFHKSGKFDMYGSSIYLASGASETMTIQCAYNESATTVSETDKELKIHLGFNFYQTTY